MLLSSLVTRWTYTNHETLGLSDVAVANDCSSRCSKVMPSPCPGSLLVTWCTRSSLEVVSPHHTSRTSNTRARWPCAVGHPLANPALRIPRALLLLLCGSTNPLSTRRGAGTLESPPDDATAVVRVRPQLQTIPPRARVPSWLPPSVSTSRLPVWSESTPRAQEGPAMKSVVSVVDTCCTLLVIACTVSHCARTWIWTPLNEAARRPAVGDSTTSRPLGNSSKSRFFVQLGARIAFMFYTAGSSFVPYLVHQDIPLGAFQTR